MPLKLPQPMEDRINNISDDELTFRGWTRDGMRAGYERRLEADKNSPQLGDVAPDFELEVLSASGGRTGDMMKLSALHGKPVGLVFGSYT